MRISLSPSSCQSTLFSEAGVLILKASFGSFLTRFAFKYKRFQFSQFFFFFASDQNLVSQGVVFNVTEIFCFEYLLNLNNLKRKRNNLKTLRG